MSTMPEDRTFHERVAEERKRRGLTQKEVAAQVGMSLRAYSDFERGRANPQGPNRRAIMRVLDPVAADSSDVGEETRAGWPADIHVFLDMMGAFLSTMDEDARLQFMHDETRRIIQHGR